MINDLAFNQDFSCLSVATDSHHKIYQCDPFGEFYSSVHAGRKRSISSSLDGNEHQLHHEASSDPTKFLRMVFSTSLTIIVPQTSHGSRTLKIFNLKQNLTICELTFSNDIVDIKFNKRRLLVFLQLGQVHIYDLSCVRLVKVLQLEPPGPVIAGLSLDEKSLLVVPMACVSSGAQMFPEAANELLEKYVEFSKSTKISKKSKLSVSDLKQEHGWVLVYDTINLKPYLVFKAHDSDIVNVCISNDSSKIITASVKGTIIRVFQTNETKIVNITNLRRGHNLAKITALSFNHENTIVGCGSDNDTIHLFKLDETTPPETPQDTVVEDDAPEDQDEDINENLAKLLISKPDEDTDSKHQYFNFKSIKNSINNSYTKNIMKKLPYKDYLENLIWEPPRRSFAYIRLQETHPRVEIGFNNDMVLVVSYDTAVMYRYQLPKTTKLDPEDKRLRCQLVNQYQLT